MMRNPENKGRVARYARPNYKSLQINGLPSLTKNPNPRGGGSLGLTFSMCYMVVRMYYAVIPIIILYLVKELKRGVFCCKSKPWRTPDP